MNEHRDEVNELILTSDEAGKKETLVFVYGTLKHGGVLNSLMAGDELDDGTSDFIGDATIMSKSFVMREMETFPALQGVEDGSGNYIYGEMWLTDIWTLSRLDEAEGLGHLFDRELIDVRVDNEIYKAWVYFMPAKHSAMLSGYPVIESGMWDVVTNAPCKNIEDTVEETEQDETIKYTVERGVYVSNEYGDSWGPFDTITDAISAINKLSESFDGSKVLNIGFRLVKTELSPDQLADIDSLTHGVAELE